MAIGFDCKVALLTLLLLSNSCGALFVQNEDNPSLLDRVLQVVWEPSSLIRMWVGLDQLFNIARSWKGVAERIASLPFDKGRSSNHIRIKEPRTYQKPSVAAQWDRFKEIYDSSNLSPLVEHAQEIADNALESHIYPVLARAPRTFNSHYIPHQLPPPFLFQPQEVLLGVDALNSLHGHKIPSEMIVPSRIKMGTRPGIEQDSLFLSKLAGMSNAPRLRMNVPNVGGNTYRRNAEIAKTPVSMNSQEKLGMFLNLLRTLGDIHKRRMANDNLASGDF